MKISEAINSYAWNEKDQKFHYIHHERNILLSLLSVMFPASLEKHQPESDVTYEWSWMVIIDLPGGQVSWHIKDDELPLFDHLPRLAGRKWNGSEDREKYQRVEATRQILKGDSHHET